MTEAVKTGLGDLKNETRAESTALALFVPLGTRVAPLEAEQDFKAGSWMAVGQWKKP
ncbi:MAG: hypothetical protein AAGG55_03160 [Pseudomonadota bacterium]